MSQSLQQAVIDFIDHIPPQINPYSAVARHLIQLIQPPSTPTWARWLQRAVLLGFVIIFIQSCFLIYSRIRSEKFRIFRFDELGLLKIDDIVIAMGYLVYSTLVIIDIILDEVFGSDYEFVGIKIMLFGCKFLAVLSCSWLFLWACVRQCASLKWNSSSHGRSFGHSMPKIIPWIVHLAFISLMLWPFPVVFWHYENARTEYNQLLHTVVAVIKSLRTSAATVTPASYNKYQLLLALLPAQHLGSLLNKIAVSVQSGIEAYLINITLLCLAYIPFLAYSLRALFIRGLSEKFYVESLVDASPAELRRFRLMSDQTRKEWNLVMLHASIAYTGTLAHLPIVVWQMTIKGSSFLQDPTWQLTTRLGLHGPFAVAGVISLFFFHHNTEMTLPDSEEYRQTDTPSVKPRKATDLQEVLSIQPEAKINGVYFAMTTSLGEPQHEGTSQDLEAPRITRERPSMTYEHSTVSAENLNPSSTCQRTPSASTRRKPVNIQGFSPY